MQHVPTATAREALIALLAMGVVALICRWVFSPTHTPVRQEASRDFGLLVAVHQARSLEDALMLRDHLVTEGVRASVNDAHEVLVFRRDVDRATSLLG
jgi:hypothetical protein